MDGLAVAIAPVTSLRYVRPPYERVRSGTDDDYGPHHGPSPISQMFYIAEDI